MTEWVLSASGSASDEEIAELEAVLRDVLSHPSYGAATSGLVVGGIVHGQQRDPLHLPQPAAPAAPETEV